MDDLKKKTVRGAAAKLCAQVANFLVRFITVIILARLLDPKDFGLVAMVLIVTGVYDLLTTGGLSSATVQQSTVTDEQLSTLFWINILIGAILGLLCLATAPVLVAFYHEPRLFWLTIVMAAGFLINAAGVQHSALLQRHLRYVTIALIETTSLVACGVAGIAMAILGYGYWALVAQAIVFQLANTVLVWLFANWMPGRPHRLADIKSMLHFGGTLTLNTLVIYIAYNADKVLLGRFWGASDLGIYERAYRLINLPTSNLNAALSGIAFSALSRLQDDSVRYKKYFLRSYSFVNSVTIPGTVFCAIFADDIISVFLGPKWNGAIPIFRYMTPTILVFGIINPTSWLLLSSGLQMRSLLLALVIAPLVISSYLIGLPYGPEGVALAYSTAMTLWLIPHIIWCLRGTGISPRDLFLSISRPFLATAVAAIFAAMVNIYSDQIPSAILRLGLGGTVMMIVYSWMLLFVLGQKEIYVDLVRGLKSAPS
jgi:O-antigen/teichoic acid export membrane protein